MARRCARMGEKLLAIRKALGLSQNGILRRLGLADELTQAEWSAYERGVRNPSLPVLLIISELAGVWMDVLVNDNLDLPDSLPANPKSEGIKRKAGRKIASKTASQSLAKRKHE